MKQRRRKKKKNPSTLVWIGAGLAVLIGGVIAVIFVRRALAEKAALAAGASAGAQQALQQQQDTQDKAPGDP